MKILFVTDLYPIGNEKIAKALYYFVQEWQKQGHEVEVIRANFILNTLLRDRKIQKEDIYFEDGTKIYNLNFNTPFWFNVYNKLPKNFSLKNYDVIISHMPCGALMANKLLKRNKIKYVCAVHMSDIVVLKDFKYIFFRKSLKRAYNNADKIAARSSVLQQKIEEILPDIQDKTFVAYSGLEDEILKQEKVEKTFNQKIMQISTVASLIKRKNIDIIIKTLSALKYDFRLTIMGDGNQIKNLVNLSKKLGIYNKIKFTGDIPREEVLKTLNKSDIFILLSNNETFGLTYLEAMASKNIIIAKKNDGIDGILQNEHNAFLINADKYELKQCLEKIYALKENKIEEIKEEAYSTVQNLSLSKAAKNYLDNITS
jgi:glycosyltransferase involved in cell wall biosynthesis